MKDFILLIPCFNNLGGLIDSLKSINYQPDKFEILVIDDGSKVPLNEAELSQTIQNIDIRVLRLQENVGIAKALNEGLKIIHSSNDYKYIARLDCGDTCHPKRFTEQVKYLDKHPEIGLLGTWCQFIDSASGKRYTYKTKTEHEDILKEMHLKCSFIHPTVMFRKEVLDRIGYYPENYPHAEDYAFFWQILKLFKGAIIPEIQVDIVMNTKTISANNFKKQALSRARIIKNFGHIPLLKLKGILATYLRIIVPGRFIAYTKFFIYR
jgi:glycosyltransferase involved in cell wall biosynthesis